jgi:alkylated DNA repair dioxygenase AlkB
VNDDVPAAGAEPRAEDAVHVDRDATADRLDLGDGAWVDVIRGWLVGADALEAELLHNVAWQPSHLFRYDHVVEENRVSSWWSPGRPLPHPALAEATRVLQHRYRVQFDGFAMLQYRDGRDGQAFHRDTDMRWLEDTIVAILSLGAQRPWLLRPRTSRYDHNPGRGAVHDLAPSAGDLLVMGGRTQATWEHSVPPQAGRRDLAPRISLQWRHARRTGRPYQGSSYRAPLHYGRG